MENLKSNSLKLLNIFLAMGIVFMIACLFSLGVLLYTFVTIFN